jgi:hypothetical protein
MDSETKHLILTRFNTASPGREQAIRLRPGWLDGRFELFRDLCLPSIAGQTRQDFEWIIFFDEQTPDLYRRQIEDLQKLYPFTAYFTPMFEMDKIVPGLVRDTSSKWLLTTRLDSDDILAKDHVERLREIVAEPRHQVINFHRGAILSIKDQNPSLYRIADDSNPFASLMEPMSSDAGTIWAVKHVEIDRIAPVLQVEGPPAWLQIVHGANVSNRVKGVRVRLDSLTDLFPYVATLPATGTETDGQIWRSNSLMGPLRQARETLRAAAKATYSLVRGQQ